jgi:hypothetical protein
MFVASPPTVAKMMLPPGWEKPSANILAARWRSVDPARFAEARGDFDGDGLPDRAMLLMRRGGNLGGLWVYLTRRNAEPVALCLDSTSDETSVQELGVATVGPGTYRTACGKGYVACDSTETAELIVPHNAIRYFKNESAESYWLWTARVKTFRRHWMSD